MANARFNLALGLCGLVLFAAVCLWQSPGLVGGKITAAELQTYLAQIEAMPIPPEERAEVQQRMRAWAETDDGKPFYMVNLMRYHQALRRYAGAPETDMSPVQANQYYENSVMHLVFKRGAYPLAAGQLQRESVLPTSADGDRWDRMIVVRYPSRRAFFELLTDPAYQLYAPYKFMAMDIALLPADAEILWPEPRWLAGAALLILFLGMGWARASRQAARSQ